MTITMEAKHVLLLTGTPGVGKTTLIRKVAAALGNYAIAGFYTEEIREGGERQGFRLISFSGERAVIAHVGFSHTHAVGKYGVDVAAIDRLAERELVLSAGSDFYIVDEIGRMECLSPHFISAMHILLESTEPLVATVAIKGDGLMEEVKHAPGCELWQVTCANRDALVDEVVSWVHAIRGAKGRR